MRPGFLLRQALQIWLMLREPCLLGARMIVSEMYIRQKLSWIQRLIAGANIPVFLPSLGVRAGS